MKRTFTRSFTLLLLFAAILTGCSKSTTQTKTDQITSGTWRMAYFGYDDDFNWVLDDYENLQYTCEEDDIWTFKQDHELIQEEGPVRCSAAIAYSFGWQLSAEDNNLITIDDRTYTIRTLDSYTLEVYYEFRGPNGPERYIKKWVR